MRQRPGQHLNINFDQDNGFSITLSLIYLTFNFKMAIRRLYDIAFKYSIQDKLVKRAKHFCPPEIQANKVDNHNIFLVLGFILF